MQGCYHLFIRLISLCDRPTQSSWCYILYYVVQLWVHSLDSLLSSSLDRAISPCFLSIQGLSMEPKEPKYSVSLEEQDSEVSTALSTASEPWSVCAQTHDCTHVSFVSSLCLSCLRSRRATTSRKRTARRRLKKRVTRVMNRPVLRPLSWNKETRRPGLC